MVRYAAHRLLEATAKGGSPPSVRTRWDFVGTLFGGTKACIKRLTGREPDATTTDRSAVFANRKKGNDYE